MQSYKSISICLVNQILFAHKLSRHKFNLLNAENFDRHATPDAKLSISKVGVAMQRANNANFTTFWIKMERVL